MRKSILVVALSEFQHIQKENLLRFAADYSDASDPSSCWNCICDCVSQWRDAQDALDELSTKGDSV